MAHQFADSPDIQARFNVLGSVDFNQVVAKSVGANPTDLDAIIR